MDEPLLSTVIIRHIAKIYTRDPQRYGGRVKLKASVTGIDHRFFLSVDQQLFCGTTAARGLRAI
jgi:hypothetical protein